METAGNKISYFTGTDEISELSPFSRMLRKIIPITILFLIGLFSVQGVSTLISDQFKNAPNLIWPASGIAIAIMLIEGYAVWPAIAIANLANGWMIEASLPATLFAAAGNTLQVIFSVFLLKKFKFNISILRLKDVFILFTVAGTATLVAPLIILFPYWLLGGLFVGLEQAGLVMWMGRVSSILIFLPFTVYVVYKFKTSPEPKKLPQKYIIEGIAWLSVFFAMVVSIFFFGADFIGGVSSIYFLLIPLFCLALRFGSRWISVCLFMLAATGVVSLSFGPDVTEISEGAITLIQLQALVIGLASFYIVSSIYEERKRATEDLGIHIKKLEDALVRIRHENKAKSDFLAMLAHEIRNPLAPIVNYLELIEKSPDPISSELKNYITTIADNVQGISRLLDDLLDISKISQQKISLKMENFDLRDILNNSIRAVSPFLNSKEQLLDVELGPGSVSIAGDKVRIQQILVNVLSNAGKYTQAGGKIKISCHCEDGMAVVRICDNGTGIEPEIIGKIFDPFKQGRESFRAGGLGVGLYMSRKLAELHGGDIDVFSEGAGKGSEFIVRLPLARNESIKELHDLGSADKISEEYKKIIVVDDNQAAAQSLGRLLEYGGYIARTCHDGQSALEAVEEFGPDIMIVDIGLPDMDGYELADNIKAINPKIKLIALTGYGQPEDKFRAEEAGFDYHLTKPAGIEEIKKAIEAVIS